MWTIKDSFIFYLEYVENGSTRTLLHVFSSILKLLSRQHCPFTYCIIPLCLVDLSTPSRSSSLVVHFGTFHSTPYVPCCLMITHDNSPFLFGSYTMYFSFQILFVPNSSVSWSMLFFFFVKNMEVLGYNDGRIGTQTQIDRGRRIDR